MLRAAARSFARGLHAGRTPVDGGPERAGARGRRRPPDRRSRGAVAVEFAIVLPLFLAVVFGIVDGSRLMLARWMVSYAVQRGGRVASMRSTANVAAVQTAVAQASSLIGLVSTNVNVEVNGGATVFTARQQGDDIHVWTTYTYKRSLAFVFPSATINVNATTLTQVE